MHHNVIKNLIKFHLIEAESFHETLIFGHTHTAPDFWISGKITFNFTELHIILDYMFETNKMGIRSNNSFLLPTERIIFRWRICPVSLLRPVPQPVYSSSAMTRTCGAVSWSESCTFTSPRSWSTRLFPFLAPCPISWSPTRWSSLWGCLSRVWSWLSVP